jgi:hypothetical protein
MRELHSAVHLAHPRAAQKFVGKARRRLPLRPGLPTERSFPLFPVFDSQRGLLETKQFRQCNQTLGGLVPIFIYRGQIGSQNPLIDGVVRASNGQIVTERRSSSFMSGPRPLKVTHHS